MSNIIINANRYNTSNTFRSDIKGSTRGNARGSNGSAIGFDCSGLVYHVLRESGYNVPYAPSSVMVNETTFSENWATPVKPEGAVQPGTLVYFSGHVGIVQSYDPVKKTGEFFSMTGKKNVGSLKPNEPFTTDGQANPLIHWGGSRAFIGLAEVKPELYDRTLDQHVKGANPNTPVFNIPEAVNAGFITLPGNGGFPMAKGVADLSSRVDVSATSRGITLPAPIDLPNANTAFATTLAVLESNGQPNNGYGGWARDGQGIGAIGRYGFRAPSLKAIGWMDANGSWTDKALSNGVSSPESFRDSPAAQEIARVEYMGKLKNELQANGSWGRIGQTVQGHLVTEAGLLAAAWKEGSGAVNKFFNGNSTNPHADKNIMFRFGRFAETALPSGAAEQAAGGGGTAAIPLSTKTTNEPVATPPQITAVVSAAGEPLTFQLGNGKLVRAGDDLDSADGRLVIFDKANDTLVVDVKVGENLYERRTYDGSGKVTTKSWEYAKDQLDAETGDAVQYFNGDVYNIAGDTYTRINIDVLNAEQQLYAAQRDWHKARADTLLQGLRLKAANATLTETDLTAINDLLEPESP